MGAGGNEHERAQRTTRLQITQTRVFLCEQTVWMPPTGWVNNCDGGRSHSYCDYRQQ